MKQFEVKTNNRTTMVDVTAAVRHLVRNSGVKSGICLVYSPHTTAGVTINENADPDVVHDLLLWYGRQVPKEQTGFRHGEGNSDSHIKTTLVGPGVTLPVEGGAPVLGRWQGIFLCEFDGPRTRTVMVQVVG